jgi:drug/metabolite transporter (DMT)-like permease
MPQRFYAHLRSPIGLIVVAYAAMVSIWGTTWLGIKVALTGVTPIAGSGVRFILAGLLMYAVASLMRVRVRSHDAPMHLILVLAAAMFGIPYALTYFAETHLSSGIVAVLFGTQPFFTFALAYIFLRERPGPLAIAGAGIAFAGVWLISINGDAGGALVFIIATLAGAISSAIANVYLKRFSHAEPLGVLPPAMLIAGVALTLCGALAEHPVWANMVAPGPLAATLYLAIFGSAIAFYLNHWLLQRISSSVVGLSSLMIPVIAVAVGALFGGEHFDGRDVAGALCVVAGLWLSLQRGRSARLAELEAAA